ncbi:MAG: hypothetical protein ABSG68_02695 [Thermoguttaceae bacterium]|jgi:hypothetical protein
MLIRAKRVSLALAVLIGVLLVAAPPSGAAIYNAANDFSTASNPNGAWSYGEYSGGLSPGTFTLFNKAGSVGPIDAWWYASTNPTDPAISHNSGALPYNEISSGTTWLPNQLLLHPYLGPTVVRFTASAAGEYDVNALFSPAQTQNTFPNAYVYLDGVQEYDQVTASGGVTYAGLLSLHTGDTIDFVVWGNNSNNKTTALDATVNLVPEPATLVVWSLLGTLAIGLGWRWRKAT